MLKLYKLLFSIITQQTKPVILNLIRVHDTVTNNSVSETLHVAHSRAEYKNFVSNSQNLDSLQARRDIKSVSTTPSAILVSCFPLMSRDLLANQRVEGSCLFLLLCTRPVAWVLASPAVSDP